MSAISRHRRPIKRYPGRRFRWVGVVALTAVLVAGCSKSTGSTAAQAAPGSPAESTSAPAAPLAAHGVEAAIGDIPWSQVGPGWTLAMWSPAAPTRAGVTPPEGAPTYATATTTLYLVDPAGGRYAITTFPPPGDGGSPELVGWSGDGSHALLNMRGPGPETVILVDLHTGAQTTLPATGDPRFTRPNGQAIILSTTGSRDVPATLKRIDLAGSPQLTYPTDRLGSTFNGAYLSTPDGTRLVLGTSAGLVMMGNDGTVGATLSIPNQNNCRPLRWWDGQAGGTVLARCDGSAYSTRLWLVPIDGGTPSALTATNDGRVGPDYGDANAWKLPAGTFVQALGACGVVYLAKLNADGTTTPVTVPNVDQHRSIVVVGVNGSHLDLRASLACGSGESLLDYDPAANTSTVLLGPPVNGGGVIRAMPYPGQE
jgi:TolB protein